MVTSIKKCVNSININIHRLNQMEIQTVLNQMTMIRKRYDIILLIQHHKSNCILLFICVGSVAGRKGDLGFTIPTCHAMVVHSICRRLFAKNDLLLNVAMVSE